MNCPIARSLERIGDWWSILIVRDAFYGLARFDEFQESLGVAPNVLTRRLRGLVEDGLFERRQYERRPPRYEYVLTRTGRDFYPVLLALLHWGNRHFSPGGPPVEIVAMPDGRRVRPVVVDAETGQPLRGANFAFAAGPGADRQMTRRLEARGHVPFATGSMNAEHQGIEPRSGRAARTRR
ncbi:MAG TPA: helix-turn-helix domain-containing protein [Polyangiaceae bacterium]|nr:helix-turn-helix domain-containing protein [Polyangiaceae bacterium]